MYGGKGDDRVHRKEGRGRDIKKERRGQDVRRDAIGEDGIWRGKERRRDAGREMVEGM